ncbi:DUF6789 family protein [Halegenticoccus tardaugens]|uniref:DUF6789 family protein n=1 Tax=Halegenticoccus tardaugens TaxID=2071624 RepID=UPI00100A7AE9|nr:DUF6789 family protein [Halegenticoccus tardaugens]
MVGNDTHTEVDIAESTSEDVAEPDFDHLTGIITDGFVGAVGGLVGTTVMTVVLLIGTTLGAFEVGSFATLSELIGLNALLPLDPVAGGYVLFLLNGMITWPLLFASIGSYLPGTKYATKGIPYGMVLWTGFVMAFYTGQSGIAFVLYLFLTLLGHVAYGFSLGSVFDYLSERPETLV